MSEPCQAACPNVMALIQVISTQTDKIQGEAATTESIIEILCPIKDDIACVTTTTGCHDEGGASIIEDLAPLPCFCSCTTLRDDLLCDDCLKDPTAPTASQCTTIGCILTSAPCESMKKEAQSNPD